MFFTVFDIIKVYLIAIPCNISKKRNASFCYTRARFVESIFIIANQSQDVFALSVRGFIRGIVWTGLYIARTAMYIVYAA